MLKYNLEKSLFGICTELAERIGLSTRSVRLWFIYTSFFTLGSPVIIYLVSAFWFNMKRYSSERRTRVWDL